MPPKKTVSANGKMKKQPAGSGKTTPISANKHKDTRKNIPTSELAKFVQDEEKKPGVTLYPRDPSLDPQLVWKGKDEQDSKDLEVPAVPIYIQEMIQPQAIIENVRAETKKETPAQISMFSDFNGLPFEEKVDFYHHDQHWTNRMILGDSLLVMNSLAEKEGLKGQVQMIYLDPPYGIKFGSNWQVSTRKRDVKDGKVEDATRQPEQVKAFRDTWELGIHSYLAYLRDRFRVAQELLNESGSIFVQIGDENVHLVRSVMDEVFGSENFISLITFRTTSDRGGKILGSNSDYLLWYAKDLQQLKYRTLFTERKYSDDIGERYTRLELASGERRVMTSTERDDISSIPTNAKIYRHDNLTSQGNGESGKFPVIFEGVTFRPDKGTWKTHPDGMCHLLQACRFGSPTPNSLNYIRFFNDFPYVSFANVWSDTQTGAFTDPKVYVVQSNTKVIERCLLMTTDPGDLVLDPTCGSGTTAYVAEQWGRRWITCDTSRVALALARTRLMAGKFPYYLLMDSPDGVKKQAELTGTVGTFGGTTEVVTTNDIKKGFVYKRVPHVTLKSIANNEEIDTIYAKYQEQMEPVREEMNRIVKQGWEDWEVPRELPKDLRGFENLEGLCNKWWELRRERQKAIDESIARRADIELLYDQPYEDNKRIRVTGPFTVESLSPHRMLTTDEEKPKSEVTAQQQSSADQFEPMIIENLAKAGVQNTRRNERLKFDRLEAYQGGLYLQAVGEYTDKNGKGQRVAVAIGPQYGTVSSDLVKEAAKEALRGYGFDLLERIPN